jgi:hypothetical protein
MATDDTGTEETGYTQNHLEAGVVTTAVIPASQKTDQEDLDSKPVWGKCLRNPVSINKNWA